MGKITYKGLVPKDDPMFSNGPELFSRPAYKPSSKSTAKNTAGATPNASASAAATQPVDPAIGAVRATEQSFGKPSTSAKSPD